MTYEIAFYILLTVPYILQVSLLLGTKIEQGDVVLACISLIFAPVWQFGVALIGIYDEIKKAVRE